MSRLRDGFLPALIVFLLLLQYAAVEHVLAHFGLASHSFSAGAPWSGSGSEADPAEQAGGCEAPQLHAVIDGTPLARPPVAVIIDERAPSHAAFLLAVAERSAPHPLSRGPPALSL